MDIREAKREDAQQINALYDEVMGYLYPVQKIEEMIDIVCHDACNYVFVAVESDQIVGIVEVVIKYSIHKPSYLIINTLAVLTSCQGKGIGGALLAYLEQFAKTRGLSLITVGSQEKRSDAHRFYAHHGYEIIKTHKIFEKKLYVHSIEDES